MMQNLLIVDDDTDHARLISKAIREHGNYDLITTASSGNEALRHLNRTQYQAVLSDIRMPTMSGIELLKRIQALPYPPAFVAMTAYDEDEVLTQILAKGAKGYVLKGDPISDIIRAIDAAFAGGTSISPLALTRLLTHHATASQIHINPEDASLSPTLKRTLDLVCQGKSNAEIAERLGISLSNTKKNVSALYDHYGVNSRSQLIIKMYGR